MKLLLDLQRNSRLSLSMKDSVRVLPHVYRDNGKWRHGSTNFYLLLFVVVSGQPPVPIWPFKDEAQTALYKEPVRTAQ